jgi:hypothetical protein
MTHTSDPPRFSDPHAQVPDALRNLFARAEQDLPTAAELERLATRLEPAFASPAGGAGLPTANPRLLWGLGVAGIAAVGVTAWLLAGRGAPPRTGTPQLKESVAVSATAAAPVAEPPAALPSANQVPAPDSAAASASVPRAGSASPQHPAAQASEAALLERARRALSADPARALALTRQHQQRFPNGILNQEREVIAIEALRRLGKGAEASERAGSFEKQYPGSAHRRALESGAGK